MYYQMEEAWFADMITYLAQQINLPVMTTPFGNLPFFFLEKSKGTLSFDRLCVNLACHFLCEYEGDAQEAEYLPSLRTLLNGLIPVKAGLTYCKELSSQKKILDKKIRQTTLLYQTFVHLILK